MVDMLACSSWVVSLDTPKIDTIIVVLSNKVFCLFCKLSILHGTWLLFTPKQGIMGRNRGHIWCIAGMSKVKCCSSFLPTVLHFEIGNMHYGKSWKHVYCWKFRCLYRLYHNDCNILVWRDSEWAIFPNNKIGYTWNYTCSIGVKLDP